jgi:subtilisin family serine protease
MPRTLRAIVAALVALAFATGARAARLDDLPRFDPARAAETVPGWRPDRVEVRLRPEAARALVPAGARTERPARPIRAPGLAGLDALAAASGIAFEPEFVGERPPEPGADAPDLTAWWLAHLPPGLDLAEALTRLRALPEVERAEPIAVLPVARVPDDSLWSAATWFYQPSRRDVRAPEAWDLGVADSGAVIAVLDTGVLPYHPDLGGTVAGLTGNLFVDRAERGGIAGVDDDGNGYVDDVSGWDFVDLASGTGVAVGEDWDVPDPDPNDYAGHGTIVAGIAAALTDNGIGVAGTAWNARLLPLRMGWSTLSNPLGLVDMSFAAQALLYAARTGATVANCSFATLDQGGLVDAARVALRAGVTIVCAAGNNGQPQDLGLVPDVLSVAAVDANDVVAAFSNQGAWVDVAAPGVAMRSTSVAHPGTDSLGARQPAYAASLSGTSYAAPLVAGGVALLQSHRRAQGLAPLAPLDVVLRVRDTAHDIADLNPPGTLAGTGRLDLERLLADPPTSYARRAGATSVGPAAVLPRASGGVTLVQPMGNQRVLLLDGASGDTLRVVSLGGRPARQVAAADLGPGLGIGVFVGLANGLVAGLDSRGDPLPGWPAGPGGVFKQFAGGPALGDIDGDGALDVVCGSSDGEVWAWGADGQVKPGFPLTPDGNPVNAPVALAQLDASPGLEIVAATDAGAAAGALHVFDGAGAQRAGWPAGAFTASPQAPVVARFTPGSEPAIVVSAGTALTAYRPDGSVRFSAAFSAGGAAAGDPALADLDADGALDIVAGSTAPAIEAFDSTGTPLAALGWPRATGGLPVGSPIVGRFLPGARQGVLAFCGTALLAVDDSARTVARFPMPGGAGQRPTFADVDADGATEVVAGTGPDSIVYVYDAGPGTHGTPMAWPTPRGGFARAGSADGPGLSPEDDLGPAAVADLRADSAGATSVRLAWTAPADPGGAGLAAYELRVAAAPIATESDFAAATVVPGLAAPGSPGAAEAFTVGGLAGRTTYWFALRATDARGNPGALSNSAGARTTLGRPLDGRVGVAVASRAQPSRLPVEFLWQGAAEAAGTPQFLRLYDLAGRLVRTLALGTQADGSVTWNGRDEAGGLVPAGLYFARLTSGSFHAQARVVLLP